ncbi:hypothetical protein [Anaerosporobacter faecicola]|uniref:hypothetical protein n=1 Tax=Anaerosporobacter faecicola TaxID=2718714 RepID=UPI00143B93C4|nr:hypothetical protein [Anaerosporobacter faecicola]
MSKSVGCGQNKSMSVKYESKIRMDIKQAIASKTGGCYYDGSNNIGSEKTTCLKYDGG